MPGNNLVINRRSLSVEKNRQLQSKIKETNYRFLHKLQNLKATYTTETFIDEHKKRFPLVERISRYPIVLDHNCEQKPV